MKVNTVEQFIIQEYLKNHLKLERFEMTLLDRYNILLEDVNGMVMRFEYDPEYKTILSETVNRPK